MGCQRDDRNVLAGGYFLLADRLRGFQAIHLRHLHVHQHQVERLRIDRGNCLPPVAGHAHPMPPFGKHYGGHALVHGAIFGQQNFQRAYRRAAVFRAAVAGFSINEWPHGGHHGVE